MKNSVPRVKKLLAWFLVVSLWMGNLAQELMVQAESLGDRGRAVYYVDCGGVDLPEGEQYGAYNGNVVDQPYDAQGEQEYRWGYDGGYQYETDTYAGCNVRLVKGDDGAALSYYFELPKGKYQVEIGIPHCAHWGNRVIDVDLRVGEGEKQNLVSGLNTTDDIPEGTIRKLHSELTVEGEKELVTVSAIRSSVDKWAPFMGYIKIFEDAEELKDALTQALEESAGIYEAGNQEGIYTETSWTAFAEAYEKALGLVGSSDKAEREEAAEELSLARESLAKAEDPGEENDVAYYVDCGGQTLPEGERYGKYNGGVVDKPYDAAGQAEYRWGYDSNYEYETDVYAGCSIRLVKGNDAAPLTYYFELPKGNYQVELGIPHCSYWGNRVMDIDLQVGEGEKQNLVSGLNTTADIAEGTVHTIESGFAVAGEKERVTISAIRSSADKWAPFFGYIKIRMDSEGKLEKAIKRAVSIYEAGNQEGIYTEESWRAFAEAYEKALGLLGSADEAKKEDAAEQLDLARQGLLRVNTGKWAYDFEDGIADASLVVNRNGISAYSGQAVYGEGRNGGRALQTGTYGLRLNKKDLGSVYTVNAWVKSGGAIPNNTPTIFLGHNSPEKWLGIAGNGSAQECKIWTRANGTYTTLPQTVKAPVGEWVMHTIQSDGVVTTVYENGEMVAQSNSIADVLSGGNQDIYLCVNFWDGQFRGLLDDVSVYGECLSEDEVYALYETRTEEEIFREEGFTAPKKKTIVSGAQKQIQVVLPKGVRNAETTFISSDEAIAAVSADGKVSGRTPGTATVTTYVKVGNTTKNQETLITVRSADQIVEEGVMYFVDCGNADTSLASDDLFGQYNRIPDQKLGVDAATGKTWGFGTIGSNDPVSGTNSRADEDSKEATYQSAGASSDFYYEFELPADIYQVEITVPYFLSGGNTRTFEVLASNGGLEHGYETIANNINTKYISGAAKTYTGTCTADGISPLRLSFLADSDAWGPIVCAIKISAVSVEAYQKSLEDTLKTAKAYQIEDYSDASFGKLLAAIRAAEDAIGSIATAKEAKELEDALKAAIKGLLPGVNAEIKILKQLLAKAKGYRETDYTTASYQRLKGAIQAAEAQLASGSVETISQAMKLEDSIQKAIDALEKKPSVKPPVAVTYQVTFDSAGGSKVAAQTVKSGQKASRPKDPVRGKYLFKGWYAGTKKYEFGKAVTGNLKLKAKWTKVSVAKPKITSVKNQKPKQCTVNVKRVSGAAGYQVVYTTDKNFRKSVKKLTSKKSQVVLKKLKKGKTYYIKARAFKYDSKGQKVYGKYSGKKKLTIKK
ncbi:LamG-like jellyroll fold domain-containing protein [Lachnospiraceae bacterium 29-84]